MMNYLRLISSIKWTSLFSWGDKKTDRKSMQYVLYVRETNTASASNRSSFLLFVIFCRLIETSDDEHRLVDHLLSEQDCNPLVRPIEHANQTAVVSLGLLLVQLIHIKEEYKFFLVKWKNIRFACGFMRKSKWWKPINGYIWNGMIRNYLRIQLDMVEKNVLFAWIYLICF